MLRLCGVCALYATLVCLAVAFEDNLSSGDETDVTLELLQQLQGECQLMNDRITCVAGCHWEEEGNGRPEEALCSYALIRNELELTRGPQSELCVDLPCASGHVILTHFKAH